MVTWGNTLNTSNRTRHDDDVGLWDSGSAQTSVSAGRNTRKYQCSQTRERNQNQNQNRVHTCRLSPWVQPCLDSINSAILCSSDLTDVRSSICFLNQLLDALNQLLTSWLCQQCKCDTMAPPLRRCHMKEMAAPLSEYCALRFMFWEKAVVWRPSLFGSNRKEVIEAHKDIRFHWCVSSDLIWNHFV